MIKNFVLLLLGLPSILSVFNYFQRQNNVCKTFSGYLLPNLFESCYYDPDITTATPKLIEKYAGNVESHETITEDGYILTMFRIPRENPKGVILLQHPLSTDSRIYLWQGNESLAMTLWRNGFDVWLSNNRGTTYSDKHVNMTTNDFLYWDFYVYEFGWYDLTSELKLINKVTNGLKVIYFGHSLGATKGLVYSSLKTEEAEKYLRYMIFVAIPSHFKYSTSILSTTLRRWHRVLEALTNALHSGTPYSSNFIVFARIAFRLFPGLLYVQSLLAYVVGGDTPSEVDPTFYNYDVPLMINKISWKTLTHAGQVAEKCRPQMYDYGIDKNLEVYGNETPPAFPAGKISVPVLLVTSFNDILTSLKDSEILFEEFSPKARTYGHWKLSGLNHFDYHIGLNRKEMFVDKLLEFLKMNS